MTIEQMRPQAWDTALGVTSWALPERLGDCAQHRCNPSCASDEEKARAFCGLISLQLILRGLLTGAQTVWAANLAGEDWFGLIGDHQALNSSAVRGALLALEDAQRQWLDLDDENRLQIERPEELALWRAVMHEIRLRPHPGATSRPESNQNAAEAHQDLQHSTSASSSRLDPGSAKANEAATLAASALDAPPASEAHKPRSSSSGGSTSDHSAIQPPNAAMEEGACLTCSRNDDSSGRICADLMMSLAHVKSADEAALRAIDWTHARSEMLVQAAGEPALPAILQRTILETEYKHSCLMNEIDFTKESLGRISNQAMSLFKSTACSEIGQQQAVPPLLDLLEAAWGITTAKDCSQIPGEQERSLLVEIKEMEALLMPLRSVPDHLLEAIERLEHLRAGLDDLLPGQQGSSSRKASRMFADAAEPSELKQPALEDSSSRVSSAAARSATANQTGEEAERKAADAAASLLQEEETEKAAVRQKQKRAQRRRVKQAKRSSHEDSPEGKPSNNLPFLNDQCQRPYIVASSQAPGSFGNSWLTLGVICWLDIRSMIY